MNDKEIILKKGINRKMLILTSLALLAMGLLFTSKGGFRMIVSL